MSTYLGQNFLNNPKVLDFIVQDIKNFANKQISSIEIGPGKAALTQHLSFIKNLKVFEKDLSFKEHLEKFMDKQNIIFWDFLSAKLEEHLKWEFYNAFWNLPYYITSPIFRKLCDPNASVKMEYWIFMIQKEVWEKIQTSAVKKSMLRFLLNYNYKIEYLKTVPAKDFSPAPKVESCLVRFSYHRENLHLDFAKFEKLMWLFNSYKRKTLQKIQKILEKQGKKFQIPENVKQKRIHELNRQVLAFILENNDF